MNSYFDPQLSIVEMKLSLEKLKALLEYFREYQELSSTLLKHYYDSLVRAGFSDREALEIIKVHGICPVSPTSLKEEE